MKKYLVVLLSAALLFGACTDDKKEGGGPHPGGQVPPPDPGTDPDPEPDNPYKTGIDKSQFSYIDWDFGETDEYYLLGYGYDATGRFAHPVSVRGKILDLKAVTEEQGYDVVTVLRAPSSGQEYFFWGDAEECREDFAVHADFSDEEIAKYKNLFRDALLPRFENDDAFPDIEYNYEGYSSLVTSHIMRFMWIERRHTESQLAAGFRADLDNLTAEEIIAAYGTHMITGLRTGWRLDFAYRSTSSNLQDIHPWFIYRSNYHLDMGSLPSVPQEGEPPLKDNIYFEFIDGSAYTPNAWMVDIVNYDGDRFRFEGMDDYSENSTTFVGFSRKPVPIYQLVIDPAKREELRTAFELYMGASN